MSFHAYPEYKPSGFDWLPEVPTHWVDRKIARDIPFVVGWTPPSGKDEYYDGDLPWVTIADMTQMSVEDTKSKISHLAVQDKGAKVVPAGSMLFSFKLSVGKVAFLTIDSYTNEAIAGFLPCGPLDLEYWKYAAPEFIPRYGRENIYGATLLNQELISSVRFAAPARAEQTQIARFLDHETARIDALIEEQQRLIELLKEKRQVVISHAVTKGLDPTVPMKDSGVEWLGEVPVHWEFGKIRYFAKIESGHTPSRSKPEYWENCTIPWVSLADVWQIRSGEVIELFETKELISEFGLANSSARLLPKGTVVLSRTASVGYSAIMGCDMATTQDFANWICGSKLDNNFLLFCFRAMKSEFDRLMMGSTHKTIYMPDIAELVCPVPPLDEQAEITAHIKISNSKFGSMIDEAERIKKLLSERRSALISAAVTGKIDVRDWQPPVSSPTHELAQEAV